MKILLLSLARTGSTTLSQVLSRSYQIPLFFEPFHIGKDASVQKSAFDRMHTGKPGVYKVIFPYIYKESTIGYEEFYNNLFKHFDIVVALTRSNDVAHFESIVNLNYKKHLHNSKNVFSPYRYSDIPDSFKEQLKDEYYTGFLTNKLSFLNFSLKSCIPVIYYEEIFKDDLEKSYQYLTRFFPDISRRELGLLSSKYKYRKDGINFDLI